MRAPRLKDFLSCSLLPLRRRTPFYGANSTDMYYPRGLYPRLEPSGGPTLKAASGADPQEQLNRLEQMQEDLKRELRAIVIRSVSYYYSCLSVGASAEKWDK